MNIILVGLIGLASGILSGLLGIGGGIIMVPLFYYTLGMELPRAIGTSLAIIIPTALAGSATHWQYQHIDLKIAASVAIFAVVGGMIGASLTAHLDTGILRKIMGLTLLFAAFKLFLES